MEITLQKDHGIRHRKSKQQDKYIEEEGDTYEAGGF